MVLSLFDIADIFSHADYKWKLVGSYEHGPLVYTSEFLPLFSLCSVHSVGILNSQKACIHAVYSTPFISEYCVVCSTGLHNEEMQHSWSFILTGAMYVNSTSCLSKDLKKYFIYTDHAQTFLAIIP